MRKIISITTDFGLKDEYAAAVKGVILSISPEAEIIDITHQVPKYNVRKGALILKSTVPYFPSGSIHLAVIDPGVGSERSILIIKTRSGKYLVGPDNGLLYPCALKEGILKIVKFSNRKYCLNQVSDTFHGRDIMAPIVGYLAKGVSIEEFGVEVSDIVKLELESYRSLNSGLEGYVIDVDDFGNIITSVPVNVLTSFLKNRTGYIKLSTGGKSFKAKIGRKFTDAAAGEIIIMPGSKGFTEIALNKGDASRKLKLKIGDFFQIF